MIQTTLVRLLFLTLMLLGLGFCLGCGGSPDDSSAPDPDTQTRSFYMGFTPWPYEASLNAIATTYNRLTEHGDIIKHHLQAGIPWQEALDESPYHPNLEADIAGRLSRTPADTAVLLSIDSLNSARDALTDYWGETTNAPRSGEWAARSWDDQAVISAYINFAKDMIERFEPDYFEFGCEASELIINDPASFAAYLIFAEAVYTELKASYPSLPVSVSLALKSPNSAEMQAIAGEWSALMQYSDILGISVYPYVFFNHADKGDPANLPAAWLTQATSLAGGKTVAISESAWIAESLVIPEFSVSEVSDANKQQTFVEQLLLAANELNMPFVIWFSVTDYDTLWEDSLARDPVARIWRDTGFYDEQQQARIALETWAAWLGRERSN